MGPILAATDLSARSDRALRRAAMMAVDQGVEMRIVHILDDDLPAAILQRRTEEVEAELSALVLADQVLGAAKPSIDVEAGQLAKLMPKLVAEQGAGLVVFGSHRDRGLGELIGAPTLARVMKAVNAPILVAVGPPTRAHVTALAGWDFSPASGAAVELALGLAPLERLTLLHSWADPMVGAPYAMDIAGAATPARLAGVEDALAEAKAGLADRPGLVVETEAMIGSPAMALAQAAEAMGADLVIVGRHARTGIARFLLGETAERVALSAPCDVLIAPPA